MLQPAIRALLGTQGPSCVVSVISAGRRCPCLYIVWLGVAKIVHLKCLSHCLYISNSVMLSDQSTSTEIKLSPHYMKLSVVQLCKLVRSERGRRTHPACQWFLALWWASPKDSSESRLLCWLQILWKVRCMGVVAILCHPRWALMLQVFILGQAFLLIPAKLVSNLKDQVLQVLQRGRTIQISRGHLGPLHKNKIWRMITKAYLLGLYASVHMPPSCPGSI